MNNKLSHLKSNIFHLATRLDVLVFTETWLKPHTASSELGLQGFVVYRRDRNTVGEGATRASGVLVAVHENFNSSLVDVDLISEAIFVKVNALNTNFIVAATYIESGTNVSGFNSFFTKLDSVKQQFTTYELIMWRF